MANSANIEHESKLQLYVNIYFFRIVVWQIADLLKVPLCKSALYDSIAALVFIQATKILEDLSFDVTQNFEYEYRTNSKNHKAFDS